MPRPEVQPVGAVAQVEEHVPQGQRVLAARHGDQHPLAGRDHGVLLDGPLDLVTAVGEKQRGQKAALWRRTSMTAGSRQTRHFMSLRAAVGTRCRLHGPSRYDRAYLDLRTLGDGAVPGHKRAVDDHENGLPLVTELLSSGRTPTGPATSTSRLGLRSRTFTPPIVARWERGG